MSKIVCPLKTSPEYKKLAKELGDRKAAIAFFRNNNQIPTLAQAKELLKFKEADYVMEAYRGDTDAHTRANLDQALKDRGLEVKGTNEEKAAKIALHEEARFSKPLNDVIPPEGRSALSDLISNEPQADTAKIKAIVKGEDVPPGGSAEKVIKMMNKAEDLQKELNSKSWAKLKKWLIKKLLYVEGRFAYLDEEYLNGVMGASYRNAKKVFDMARGAGARSAKIFDALQEQVYSQVPRQWKPVLDRLIETKRSILLLEKMNDGTIKQSPHFKDDGFKMAGDATLADYQAMLVHIKEQAGPEMFKKLDAASETVSQTLRGYITKLKEAGILSEDLANYLDEVHTFYSPREIIRMLDPEGPMRDGEKNIVVGDSGIEALKGGSELALNHDWEVLASNYIGRSEARIAKNQANRALAAHIREIFKPENWGKDGKPDNPANMSIEKKVTNEQGKMSHPAEPPAGMERVPFSENGVIENILMPKDLAADWVLFDPAMKNSMAKALGMLSGSNFVKAMATGINPEFGIFNFIRDLQLYTYTTDVYSKFVPVAWGQMIGDMASLRPGSKAYHDMEAAFIREGGSLEFQADMGRESAIMKYLKKNDSLRNLANMLTAFNRTSEMWTRLALMKRGIDSKMSVSDAAYMARKVCDFATGGEMTKTIDKVVPYFNPAMVVTRNVGEYFRKNPAMATFKAAQYIVLGMGMAYWNRMMNKDGWESVSDRDKESMWIFSLPVSYNDEQGIKRHMYIRLPKDQAFRVFSTIGEQITEKSLTGKVNMDNIQTAVEDAIPVSSAQFVPPTVKAFLSYSVNKDFYNKVDIWNGRKVSPENEWTMQTPELAVLWGHVSGMSPERTEGALSNIFPANPYTWAIGAIGNAVIPDDNGVQKSMAEYILNLPGARKLVRLSSPIQLSEMQKDRAKTLGVSLVNPDGTPREARIVRDEILRADVDRGDLRQIMDNELDKHIIEAKLEGTRKALDEFLFSIPDPKERTRLNIRLKEKARDVWMLK